MMRSLKSMISLSSDEIKSTALPSLRWRTSLHADGAEIGIDTAPTHPALATTPNHLHRADGSVVADPLTRIDRSPEENLARVIEALGRDPQLADHAP